MHHSPGLTLLMVHVAQMFTWVGLTPAKIIQFALHSLYFVCVCVCVCGGGGRQKQFGLEFSASFFVSS
jgi:hypothetical protein